MTELVINMDIVIPTGTPRRKYGKCGIYAPIEEGHVYKLIHEGFYCDVPKKVINAGKIFVMPGDILVDYTEMWAHVYIARHEEDL